MHHAELRANIIFPIECTHLPTHTHGIRVERRRRLIALRVCVYVCVHSPGRPAEATRIIARGMYIDKIYFLSLFRTFLFVFCVCLLSFGELGDKHTILYYTQHNVDIRAEYIIKCVIHAICSCTTFSTCTKGAYVHITQTPERIIPQTPFYDCNMLDVFRCYCAAALLLLVFCEYVCLPP